MLDISKIWDEYLKNKYNANPRKRESGRYYVTDLTTCFRRAYYLTFFPKPVDLTTARTFEIGNIFDQYFSSMLRKQGFDTYREERSIAIPVHTGKEIIIIAGRLDDFVIAKKGEKSYVLEGKTTKSLAYLTKPKEDHVLQITPYLFAMNASGIIFYMHKVDGSMLQFEVEKDISRFEYMTDRAIKLHGFVSKKALPPPEAKQRKDMNWLCKYCQHADICEKNINVS